MAEIDMAERTSLARRVYRSTRSSAAAIRDAYDSMRHPRRREMETERLRSMKRPTSILFVCLGNVCRSPYAEWSLRKSLTPSPIELASAGFIGPDRTPPEVAIEAAREMGVEHATNRSQLVTTPLLDDADVVFLFQGSHKRKLGRVGGSPKAAVFLLGDFDPLWDGKRTIVDPWGKPLEEFIRTFTRIDRCLSEVRTILTGD